MDNKLGKLLNKIELNEKYYPLFLDCDLESIVTNKDKTKLRVVITCKSTLDLKSYQILKEALNSFFETGISLEMKVESPNFRYIEDYYNYFIDNLDFKLLKGRLRKPYDRYVIEVYNENDQSMLTKDIKLVIKCMDLVGYCGLEISLNEYNRKIVSEEINKDLEKKIEVPDTVVTSPQSNTFDYKNRPRKVKDSDDEKAIMGELIELEVSKISDIVGECQDVCFEAEVFNVELFESSKSGFKIYTLSVTDYTDSMYVKIFTKDENVSILWSKIFKPGKWFKFAGYTKYDAYSNNELVLNAQSINYTERKKEQITDTHPIKRVELHAHTMMSQMDGVIPVDCTKHTCELVTEAMRRGYKGIAITDHNCCQAFPAAYTEMLNFNKGKAPEDQFKVIFGTEMTLVDDNVEIIKRMNPDNVLLDNTYVVFDLETTGFNAAAGDSIIEIGAVKIKNGEILEQYDELIKPPAPIREEITNVTNITNEMLEGKRSEEEAVKDFIKWVGDLPMVAHNAHFDTSFIEMCYQKYNLGEYKNTILDTMIISRVLDSGESKHTLSAITKRYDVTFDEESHHRANYDAEGTALVLHKMLKKLETLSVYTEKDLDALVDKDNIYKIGRSYHVNLLARTREGLKNLFRIVSLGNTKQYYRGARILKSQVDELREGILVGSGCCNSEIFSEAKSKDDNELRELIGFYDYVEVQPPEVYNHLVQTGDFTSEKDLIDNIKRIVNLTIDAGKLIVATGDVHHMNREDKIFREIIIDQKNPGGGLHPLAKKGITEIPSMHLRTTEEMLNDFSFLGKELANKIVVTDTNKILDMVDIFEVIIDTGGIPYSPRVKGDDGNYLDCPMEVTHLVFDKAESWYGNPLPKLIEERIAKELYGDILFRSCTHLLEKDNNYTEDNLFNMAHEKMLGGKDVVKETIKDYLKDTWDTAEDKDGPLTDEKLDKKLIANLGGIIGGGFDPIYLIAQRLVKHSNDRGYLVGSRGSVGSSFVATMMGITEVNALPPHYLCPNEKCKHSEFNEESGESLALKYSGSGYDLPEKNCPLCGTPMRREGQSMPFATFLGFNADKVPDIDLNFSGDLDQAEAHAYTKVLFGEDNVYRAGTIGTVAEKTAYGFVKGYLERREITNVSGAEIDRLSKGCTGVKRTTGQHPGGIVVIPDYMEVYDFTPFQYPADDVTAAWRTTHFDYHAIDQDVLKLDILGHDDPTILRMLQDISGIDVKTLPMSDPKVLSLPTSTEALGVTPEQIMCPTGTLGVPEMGTNFTIGMLIKAKPKTFGDLVKISGLSHGTDVWTGNAESLIDDNICEFSEVIGCRDDIMVYLQNHGLKDKDAFKIMEFVRKGKASKDPEGWLGWKQKMIEAGIVDWYIDSCQKIKYMFPKAHACAYIMSALRIAWFKVYKPAMYYATFFSIRATDFDIETMIKGYDAIYKKVVDLENKGFDRSNKDDGILESIHIALEASARGIKFGEISLEKSQAKKFIIDPDDPNTLVPPFSTIDGLGDTVAESIVSEREKLRQEGKKFLSIEDLQQRAKISGTLIEKLKEMHILDNLQNSNQCSLFDF